MPTDWLDPEAPVPFDDESPDDYHSECGYLWREHREVVNHNAPLTTDLICPSEQEQRERFGK